MSFANVDIGTIPGDGRGDPLRSAFNKINQNFANIDVGNITVNVTAPVSSVAGRTGNVVLTVNDIPGAASQGYVDSSILVSLGTARNYTDLKVSTTIASTVANLVASAPGTLDTLNELAAALGDDANFSTTVLDRLAGLDANVATLANLSAANLSSVTNNLSANIASETARAIAAESALGALIANAESNISLTNSNLDGEITELESSLISLVSNTDSNLASINASLSSAISNVNANVSTLSSDLATESNARATADTTLQNNINAEANARVTADTTLQNNIDGVSSSLTSLIANAESNISTVSTSLSNEITRATQAESALGNLIANAESNISSVSSSLTSLIANAESNISTVSTSLSNEITRATQAEADLASNIALKANTANLSIVATSGNYSDLSGTPVLATVATSGSYTDLIDTPTIPTAYTDSNVATLLSAFGSNSISTTGNIGGNYILGNGKYLTNVQVTTDVPDQDYGSAGDESGMIAIDENNIYYCFQDYTSETNYTFTSNDSRSSVFIRTSVLWESWPSYVTAGWYLRRTDNPSGNPYIITEVQQNGIYAEVVLNNFATSGIGTSYTATNPGNIAIWKSIPLIEFETNLASVATSGNYSDLSGTPVLANVATSGNYSDLSGTPVLSTNVSEFNNDAGYITGIDFANVSAKPTTLAGYGITDAVSTGDFTFSNNTLGVSSTDSGITINANGLGEIVMSDNVGIHNDNPGYMLHVGKQTDISQTGSIGIAYGDKDTLAGMVTDSGITVYQMGGEVALTWDWSDGQGAGSNPGSNHARFGIFKNGSLNNPWLTFDRDAPADVLAVDSQGRLIVTNGSGINTTATGTTYSDTNFKTLDPWGTLFVTNRNLESNDSGTTSITDVCHSFHAEANVTENLTRYDRIRGFSSSLDILLNGHQWDAWNKFSTVAGASTSVKVIGSGNISQSIGGSGFSIINATQGALNVIDTANDSDPDAGEDSGVSIGVMGGSQLIVTDTSGAASTVDVAAGLSASVLVDNSAAGASNAIITNAVGLYLPYRVNQANSWARINGSGSIVNRFSIHSEDPGATLRNYGNIETNGAIKFANGTMLFKIVSVPTTSIGQAGDVIGMTANDANYHYYCTADYDGVTNIWKRVGWTSDTW